MSILKAGVFIDAVCKALGMNPDSVVSLKIEAIRGDNKVNIVTQHIPDSRFSEIVGATIDDHFYLKPDELRDEMMGNSPLETTPDVPATAD